MTLAALSALLLVSAGALSPVQARERHHGHGGAVVINVSPKRFVGRHVQVVPLPRVVYMRPHRFIVAQAPAVIVHDPYPVVVAEPPPIQATPISTPYHASNGLVCREYQASVQIGGMAQPSYGTACLQPDGTWRIAD